MDTRLYGTRFFASPGSASWAGVGILVRESFLQQFYPVSDEPGERVSHCEYDIEPGRIACLHLLGSEGSLDLMVCYLETGNARRARDSSRAAIASAMRPPTLSLTVLAGDFNYVCKADDRFGTDSLAWSGSPDVSENCDFLTNCAYFPSRFLKMVVS